MNIDETPCQKENRLVIEMIEFYYKSHDLLKESKFNNIKQAASVRSGTHR